MTVWVLFIWLSVNDPVAVMSYDNKVECTARGERYKRHACVKVTVPK